MIEDEIVVMEYWSEDKTKNTKVLSSKTIYPDMYKLVMKESVHNRQLFKFFKDLYKAELEAKEYIVS